VLLGARIVEIGLLGLAKKSATGTLLLDQIEKAHPRVLDLFLQIIDAARVTMASGETLDRSGFYIVFTSTIAASEIFNLQRSSFTTMNATFWRRHNKRCVPNSTPQSQRSWSLIV
jgi:ATP-dependent Clp protease ATP-binding subunit ClpA